MKQETLSLRGQRGTVLIIGLIFLAMLSLLGVAAYSVATQEERMSGNTRERIRAFESAEASLRDCESVLVTQGALPAFDGSGGAYTAPAPDQPQTYEASGWNWKDDAKVRVMPTGASISGVALQPRCILERVDQIPINEGPNEGQPLKFLVVYRVTAVGYGANSGTSTLVQTTYVRP